MGAGASNFEPSAQRPTSMRYLCHECNSVCFENEIIASSDSGEKLCPMCRSTFVEEINVIGGSGGGGGGGGGGGEPLRGPLSEFGTIGGGVSSFLARQNLSAEQSRRLANATMMLRLLDRHLRQELDMFEMQRYDQTEPFLALGHTDAPEKQQMMSDVMRARLRFTPVTMDMICSLPSCPICCEVRSYIYLYMYMYSYASFFILLNELAFLSLLCVHFYKVLGNLFTI